MSSQNMINKLSQRFPNLGEKSIWIMLLLGFSAGIPILLVFGTLSIWLNEAGVKKSMITYFSWVGLGYGFKFVWAPLVDHIQLPLLGRLMGRRRSWLLFCQIMIIAALLLMANTDPSSGNGLLLMALFAVLLGFSSATQDIVIDAYRIEMTPPSLLGLSASTYTFGYRIAMIMAGSFALILSAKLGSSKAFYDHSAWQITYSCMGLLMLVGVLTTLLVKEPLRQSQLLDGRASLQLLSLFIVLVIPFITVYIYFESITHWLFSYTLDTPLSKFMFTTLRFSLAIMASVVGYRLIKGQAKQNVKQAYWLPIKEFIERYQTKWVVLILLLIGFYRVSDIVLGVIANVFYQDMGYSKETIAYASKTFGVIVTLLGSVLGGFLISMFTAMRLLLVGAILAPLTNLLFILLANGDGDVFLLYLVIVFDNLAAGIATIAFITFLSKLSNIEFTATQYAIFSSMMILLPKLIAGYSGTIVESFGYSQFFFITMIIGIPVIFLVMVVSRFIQFKD